MKGVRSAAHFLQQREARLVTAESCTAGLIASALADLPGAGAYLDCAFVTYSPQAKARCLGVPSRTLRSFNLTSEAVACEMALGALRHSQAQVAIANTGVADSTDPDIPPGTQCFAWAFQRSRRHRIQVFSETRQFLGGRNAVRSAAAAHALQRLLVHGERAWPLDAPTATRHRGLHAGQ